MQEWNPKGRQKSGAVLYLWNLDQCWFQYNMYVLVHRCVDFHVLKGTKP